jgi:Uncharacterised nucleotidyltransferase
MSPLTNIQHHSANTNLLCLLWSAGAGVSLDGIEDVDEETLLQALLRNKMTSRFVHRVSTEGQKRFSASLIEEARRQVAITRTVNDDRATELRRLDQVLEALGPVMVKGPTALLLTQDERNLRFTNDIDLITDRPDELVEQLEGEGYESSDDFCRPHEFASLYRDNVNIDVQTYMPVVWFGSEAANAARPDQNPGIWMGLEAAPEAQLTYELLSADSFPHPLAPHIRIPQASLAYVVACVHMCREYHQAAVPLPYATIRLGELCEIRDLARLPSFVPSKAALTTEMCRGVCSRRFVDDLCSRIWSCSASIPANDLFPFDVWFPGFSVFDDRVEAIGDLLIRTANSPAEKYIERLGLESVTLDGLGRSQPMSMSPETGERPIGRALVTGNPPRFTVEVRLGLHELEVTTSHWVGSSRVVILITTGDVLYEVAVDSGTSVGYTRRRRNTRRPKPASGSAKWKESVPCTVSRADGRTDVRLVLDWSIVDRPVEKKYVLMIGCRYETEGRSPSGCLMPLALWRDVIACDGEG